MAQVSYDLDFHVFGTFSIESQKGGIVGGKSWSKTYRENKKTLLQEYNFSQNFFAQGIFELKALKKARSYMTWALEDLKFTSK
jgi:hypothetical protein